MKAALDADDLDAARAAAEKMLVLDPERAEVAPLLGQIRDREAARQNRNRLTDAEHALMAGDLTGASQLLQQILRDAPGSPDAVTLSRKLEQRSIVRERERARQTAAAAARQRAQQQIGEGAFEAALRALDELFALAPDDPLGQQLARRANDGIAAREQRLLDARAQEVLGAARLMFDEGKRREALDRLRQFVPQHAAIDDALAAWTDEERRLEREAEEVRRAEAKRLAAAAAEQARLAEVERARLAKEARLAEEARRAEHLRLEAERVAAAERARLVEVERVRLATEARLAEEARRARNERLQAEQAAAAEQARLTEEARRAEEARLAEEARRAREARLQAELAAAAEQARLTEMERVRLANEARLAEAARRAERLRLEAEKVAAAERARLADAERVRLAEEARSAEATRQAKKNGCRPRRLRLQNKRIWPTSSVHARPKTPARGGPGKRCSRPRRPWRRRGRDWPKRNALGWPKRRSGTMSCDKPRRVTASTIGGQHSTARRLRKPAVRPSTAVSISPPE